MQQVESLWINHVLYTKEQMQAQLQPTGHMRSWLQEHFAQRFGSESFEVKVADFLAEWFTDDNLLTVMTSGSTGTPKRMLVSKEKMLNSARLTLDFLQLQPKDTAYLCMPVQYIAGKMMVVRALLGGLDLLIREPSGRPLLSLVKDNEQAPVFAAMIPMQVYNTLQAVQQESQLGANTEHAYAQTTNKDFIQRKEETKHLSETNLVSQELAMLYGIKQLIIGGGGVDQNLGQQLLDFPHAVWSTYGMTETLSHIALRRLNGPLASAWYTPFVHVGLSTSVDQTLVIDAPLVANEKLVTNDIVRFNEQGQFMICGRRDNTINTGGVKVQIEEVEQKLKEFLDMPFMVTACRDAKFGQKVVLLVQAPQELWINLDQGTIEQNTKSAQNNLSYHVEPQATTDLQTIKIQEHDGAEQVHQESKVALQHKIQNALAHLPQYWRAREVLMVETLPQTGTGKPDRATAMRLANYFFSPSQDSKTLDFKGYVLLSS